jgi:hypothetical protein
MSLGLAKKKETPYFTDIKEITEKLVFMNFFEEKRIAIVADWLIDF